MSTFTVWKEKIKNESSLNSSRDELHFNQRLCPLPVLSTKGKVAVDVYFNQAGEKPEDQYQLITHLDMQLHWLWR